MKNPANLKREAYRGAYYKGRQDRDGIYEVWLTNRFEHTETPTPTHNPYIVAEVKY